MYMYMYIHHRLVHVYTRWMKMWGVQVASEGRMRKEASSLVGNNIAAEVAPFTSAMSRNGCEVRPAPFVYVPHLWEKIESVLEQHLE